MDEDEILDIYNREMSTPKLTSIPQSFYKEVRILLHEREKGLKETMDAIMWKAYANLVKTVNRIVEKRIEKILMAAKEDIPIQGTPEEMELYLAVKKGLEEFRAKIEKPAENEEDQEKQENKNNAKESAKAEVVKVKIIMPVDQYQGLDGNVYGPYVPGQLVEIPKEEAEWLIANGFAEKA